MILVSLRIMAILLSTLLVLILILVWQVSLKVPVIVRLEGTNVDEGKRILKVIKLHWICESGSLFYWTSSHIKSFILMNVQESGMALITAEDLDDAAEKAVKAAY